MAKLISPLMIFVLFHIISIFSLTNAISYCNGPCRDLNDCDGQLICINGKCNDDPDIGTHICKKSPSPGQGGGGGGGGGGCKQHGTLQCRGTAYPTYTCSPQVTSSTPAKLTFNDFAPGGDGGGPSKCDDQYHNNNEKIVALSTGWFAGSSRCLKMIRINGNGRSVTAKVVDECDSMNGCDQEHSGQPPCKNNIVDGSKAVWDALGLNTDIGVVSVSWSMA